jgi:hypothetical protein
VARVEAPTTDWLVSHRAWLFTPCPDPHGSSSLIRDASGEGNALPKGEQVLVDTAHHVPVPDKSALRVAAAPDPSFDFLFPAAYRTPARCSPLTAGEARDAGAAGRTHRIKLGTMVTGMTYRHPGMLMKTATTLDVLLFE